MVVGDETCLPELFIRFSAPFDRSTDNETIAATDCRTAGKAIAAIGGKKAVDGLASLAKRRESSKGERYDLSIAAIRTLGMIGSEDAQTAIKAIAALAAKTRNRSMADEAASALKASQETKAAAEDLKAAAAKPAK